MVTTLVAAPGKIHMSMLERYIPPTSLQEYADFFWPASQRSTLADRLTELSIGGSLILVYPTKAGAETFCQSYLRPVLDPILRKYMVLNGLTTSAAEILGTFAAVEAMQNADDLNETIQQLCTAMTRRTQNGSFVLSYSNKTSVVLDHEAWVECFIEQEESRIKLDLTEYQQEGGRMPRTTNDNIEYSVGEFARDIIGELRASESKSAGASIETGVFVISRVPK